MRPRGASRLIGSSRERIRPSASHWFRCRTGQPLGEKALVGAQNGIALIDARTGRRLRSYRLSTTSPLAGDAPVP
jgi:hypothetical protein